MTIKATHAVPPVDTGKTHAAKKHEDISLENAGAIAAKVSTFVQNSLFGNGFPGPTAAPAGQGEVAAFHG